jgi:biofilm PGA synthesis N-glycosyltransferase PgaC
MNLQQTLNAIEASNMYTAAIVFYGLYPLMTCFIYIVTAIIYYFRRPMRAKSLLDADLPFVSVLLPAYCEEDVIEHSIKGILNLDYPRFELLIINDGSTDKTSEKVRPFLSNPKVRFLDKVSNEGKAMALNDGILCSKGELIMVMDADAVPDPGLLRAMVPHFKSARVAAVAGNPRVRNATNLLSKLQAIEFSSVIGLMRRAQRIWGRVMCVSGVVGMFRKSALIDVGMFTPGMATEDIDLTWKLQTKFYDVRYEGSAMVWMLAPETVGVWWSQRKRWALGLGQVLRRYSHVLRTWQMRRMFPLYIESAFSYLWSLTFVVITLFWIFCYSVGHPPRGGSPIPSFWGMVIYTFCLLQLACGAWLDSKYDREILHSFPVSIIYPTVYWMLLALTSCFYTTKGLFKRVNVLQVVRWNIKHSYAEKP